MTVTASLVVSHVDYVSTLLTATHLSSGDNFVYCNLFERKLYILVIESTEHVNQLLECRSKYISLE